MILMHPHRQQSDPSISSCLRSFSYAWCLWSVLLATVYIYQSSSSTSMRLFVTGLFINEFGYEPVVYWGQSTLEINLTWPIPAARCFNRFLLHIMKVLSCDWLSLIAISCGDTASHSSLPVLCLISNGTTGETLLCVKALIISLLCVPLHRGHIKQNQIYRHQ